MKSISTHLRDIVSTDFVLLPVERSVELARALLASLQPERVIVEVATDAGRFFLLAAEEALARLEAADSEAPLAEALDLPSLAPVPALDAYSPAAEAPDRCIVVMDGRVEGFFDADIDPSLRHRVRWGDGDGSPVLRFLAAETPASVTVGEAVLVLVSLLESEGGQAGGPMTLALGMTLDLWLVARSGFVVEGPAEGTLVVTDEPETLPWRFRLRAMKVCRARIEVFAFHGGRCLGKVVLSPEVVGPRGADHPTRSRSLGERDGKAGAMQCHAGPLFSVDDRSPDLVLMVFERRSLRGSELTLRLAGPDASANSPAYGPVVLQEDSQQFFSRLFADFEGLGGDDPGKRASAERRLEARGCHLFQSLLPPELQCLVWSLRERIRSLQVLSEEPWVPWELCRLVGKEGDQLLEDGFFGERFAVCRWLLGAARKPRLSLDRVGLVVSEGGEAEGVSGESDDLEELLRRGGRQVQRIAPRHLPVMEALASGVYTGLHFGGHGVHSHVDPDRSGLLLEGRDALTPLDLAGRAGNLGKAAPLVFFNACTTGRTGLALTGLGGWAARLLAAGAAAYVGTYWAVTGAAAGTFSLAFYGRLLAGDPIGEAVRQARIAVRAAHEGDPSWLAYTAFADPQARVE